jgi:hypothetical protein
MPKAFVGGVRSMEHHWAALVTMSVLLVALRGMSVHDELETIAVWARRRTA